MTIDILDAGNYFKGLLLLIRKDHKITEHETRVMKQIGRALGLEPRFCETAINEILENRFIDDTPPGFSSPDLARKFLRDGVRIAVADGEIHDLEEQWLAAVADANDIALEWLTLEVESGLDGRLGERYDAFDLNVQYQGI